ncbi:MAG: hypothetical protein U0414_40795 [Polyangiaceae bacterium]
MRATALAVFAILATASEAARAEPAGVTLSYDRKDAAQTTCPDEATFRTIVIARLGYDPFGASTSGSLAVDFRPQGAETAGSFVLTGPKGEKRAERTLRDADCFETASSLALAVAIAVDPDAVRLGPVPAPIGNPPTEPKDPPRDPPPKGSPKDPPDDRPSKPPADTASLWAPRSPRARLTAAFVMPVGLTPAPRGGVRVGAGVDGHLWSVLAEGEILFPSSETSSFGSVSAWVARGSLVPCAGLPLHRILLLDLCAAGSIGAIIADAEDVGRASPVTEIVATVGPRAGLLVKPWDHVGFEATFEVPVNLDRAHLVIEDRGEPKEVWAASRVGFVGGLGLVFSLP